MTTIPLHASAPPSPFSARERDTLRALLGRMIPASEHHQVPGADDALILADIVQTLASQAVAVQAALGRLDELAQADSGEPYAALDTARQNAVALQFRQQRSPGLSALLTAVAQCYYRDERVMRSLGMPARPPFPQGYELAQGDWSLLDPVRARPPVYKKV